jgi:hypothetical protein
MARFTHSSVREYVESIFTVKEAHTMAAQVCLDYIPHLKGGCTGFGLYACLYWPFHCGQASLSTGWKSTKLGKQLVLFLSQSKRFEKPNNLQPAIESLSPQTLRDSLTPSSNSTKRQTWMSVVREGGLIDSEQLGLIYISNGTQRVPDDFRIAYQFNWL